MVFFWILMWGAAAMASILMINPIPLIGLFVLWLLVRPKTSELASAIKVSGGDPALPPAPTSAVGCAGFIVWGVVMFLVVMTFLGLTILAMGG